MASILSRPQCLKHDVAYVLSNKTKSLSLPLNPRDLMLHIKSQCSSNDISLKYILKISSVIEISKYGSKWMNVFLNSIHDDIISWKYFLHFWLLSFWVGNPLVPNGFPPQGLIIQTLHVFSVVDCYWTNNHVVDLNHWPLGDLNKILDK